MYSKIRKYNTDIHILAVDPKKYEVVLVATDGNTLKTVPNIENSWMLNNGYKRVGAINGGFFQSSGMANGWEFTDYNYLHAEGWQDGIFEVFFKDGKLIIDDVDKNKFNSQYNSLAQWGLSASYCLVRNGAIDTSGTGKFSHATSANPRTMIGQKANGEVLLIVCEGRGKANSTGLTASQQAQVCFELGCVNAINLDGGGSSTLEYGGAIKNTPTDGSLRKVANAIVVYGKEAPQDNNVGGENKMTKKLVLDAGHGYNTAGKRTPDGIREWYMNDRVCQFVAKKLEKYDIEVHRVDDVTGKTEVARTERVRRTDVIAPDLFISVHHNATGDTWVDNVTGTEIYYHPQGTAKDKQVANILAPKLSAHTGLKNRGVKTSAFDVLHCKATAILAESGFMNSKIDHPVITTWGMEAYAEAIVETVVEFLGLVAKPTQPEPTPTPEPTPPVTPPTVEDNTQYRVIVATMTGKANAQKLQQELVEKGYKDTWLMAVPK